MSAPNAPAGAADGDELDDFGSFTAAERLSDPYADVYGLPVEQPADTSAPPTANPASAGSPSLLSFSPVSGPALALNVSPRSLADPFADIVAASAGASTSAAATSAANTAALLSFSPLAGANSHGDRQETDAGAMFSVPAMDLLSAGGGDHATSSAAAAPSASGLLLPPPRSSMSPAFPSSTAAAPSEPQPVVDDLLSFSPLAADSKPAPFADVFGSIGASSAGSFDAGSDELFAMTATADAPTSARAADGRATNSFSVAAPVSAFGLSSLSDALPHVPASAPASLHGSFKHDASSFAASATTPDEENDDWTDFVAADDATNEEAAVDFGHHDQEQSAMIWEAAPDTPGPFDALGSSNKLVASSAREEPALDASSSSLGAFELPSPQSLGIEGAASASVELKPDIYFFSQGSSESTGAEEHKAGQEEIDDQDFARNDSERKPEALAAGVSSSVDAELDAFAVGGVAGFDTGALVESSGTSKEEADLWGPLSPPSSSQGPADVEEKSPAMSAGSSSSAGQDAVDVSALDPFNFAGSSTSDAGVPTSNDSSGDYYDLLAGTTMASSAPIEFTPIGFTSVATGDEDAFGDFSAGNNAVAFSEFAPVSSTPSSTADDYADVVAQQSVTTVVGDSVSHATDATGDASDAHEESKSELANSFPETVVETVDPVGAIEHSNDAFPSDTVGSGSFGGFVALSSGVEHSPDRGDDAFGDFAQGPASPERADGNPGAVDTPDSFAQSSVESDDARGVDSHVPGDDLGDFAHSSGVSTTEGVHAVGGDDEFDDFARPSSISTGDNATADGGDDAFGGFAQSSGFSSNANANGNDDDDDFGDFAHSATFTSSATANANDDDDDGFGDFAQSTAPSADTGDDFGDFAQGSAFGDGGDDDFGDFSTSSAPAPSTGADDDAFGDFSSPPASVGASQGEAAAVSSFASDEDLAAFFRGAFADVSVSVTIDASTGNADEKFTSSYVVDSVSTPMTAGFVADIVNAAVETYVANAAANLESKSDNDDTSRSNKLQDGTYIKYVLTEKIQEASQQNGIFPHGSEPHQSYLAIAAAGEPAKMRAALKSLQDELFHKSVNDAMMRIARQAALSAKAKIAEQAAQQQANAKGSSLLATTRQLLLSRNGGGSGSGANASGSHDKDRNAAAAAVGGGSLGVLTPTGASVHKHSRFSFGHEDASASSGATGTGDGKSDVPKRRHSGSSEADIAHGSSVSTGTSRTSSFGGTSSSGVTSGAASASSNGGLMKKFQDRFSSFSSSRHHNKTRVVSLRRMGQSGEDVRAMEINMDSISGGLDEVKWKCARFLYDVEEVSHVAPAQIRILSYPGNQVLSSKSDRSALVKFLKPGAVWTIDIGASNNDMLNEW